MFIYMYILLRCDTIPPILIPQNIIIIHVNGKYFLWNNRRCTFTYELILNIISNERQLGAGRLLECCMVYRYAGKILIFKELTEHLN